VSHYNILWSFIFKEVVENKSEDVKIITPSHIIRKTHFGL